MNRNSPNSASNRTTTDVDTTDDIQRPRPSLIDDRITLSYGITSNLRLYLLIDLKMTIDYRDFAHLNLELPNRTLHLFTAAFEPRQW